MKKNKKMTLKRMMQIPQNYIWLALIRRCVKVMLALLLFIAHTRAIAQNKEVSSSWIISTIDTESNYTPAYLANGIVGLRSDRTGLRPVSVHLNGFYDRSGDRDNARLINEYNPLQITILLNNGKQVQMDNNIHEWHQTLNLKEAILSTTYNYDSLHVETQLAALRNLPVAALAVYSFTAMDDISFTVQNKVGIPNRTSCVPVYKPLLNYKVYQLSAQSKDRLPIMSARFPTESGNGAVAGANTYYFDAAVPALTYTKTDDSLSHSLSFTISLKKGERFRFCLLSTFQHTGFTADPYSDAIRLSSREYHRGYQQKLNAHKKEWAELWKSDIEIEGDAEAQQIARMGLYSLYSSSIEGFGLSIPPVGLQNEWGAHIFWDADMWMYPALLVMQPSLAKEMMDFRFKTLAQAKKQAAEFGYKGAMYPWESDLQGNENTSTSYKLDMTEHHISADIAIAAWNYYTVTNDKEWLKQKGYPIIKEVANFWLSRVAKDSAGKYHIYDVVGSDEYAEDVNDDAFTNGVVKLVFSHVTAAALVVQEVANSLWKKVGDGLVILQHKDGHTLQNETYHGQVIKQADVNLLAFPLNVITDKKQIKKDLEYYQPKINPKGPAMSYSVLAGAYARIGDAANAYELFRKGYHPNLKPPFQILAERSTNNIAPFCTGYGGLLQAILFGFGGLQITDKGLVEGKSNLPANWKKLTIKRSGKKDIVHFH